MSKSPIVITNTDQLSRIADAMLARIEALNPKMTRIPKNTMLNVMADELLPSQQNWGSLKAKTGPVYGKGLTASDLQPEVSMQGSCLSIDEGLITVHFSGQGENGSDLRLQLDPFEAIMIEEALFGEKPQKGFHTYEIAFEVEGNMIVAVHDLNNGDTAITHIKADDFKAVLETKADDILQALIKTERGEAIHYAFITVAETDGDIEDAEREDESGEEFSKRCSRALDKATRAYVALGATNHRHRYDMRHAEKAALIDDILDRHWTLLLDEMNAPSGD
jgi:hypothetical protein